MGARYLVDLLHRTRGPQAPRASAINRSNTECACFNYFISRCHAVTNKLIGSAHALNSVAIDIKSQNCESNNRFISPSLLEQVTS